MCREDLGGGVKTSIAYLGFSLLVFGLSVAIHELGHRKRAWQLGYQSKIELERVPGKLLPNICTVWWGDKHSLEKEKDIILAGIIYGCFPLLVWLFFLDWVGLIPIITSIIMYFFVIRSDLKRIQEIDEVLDKCSVRRGQEKEEGAVIKP